MQRDSSVMHNPAEKKALNHAPDPELKQLTSELLSAGQLILIGDRWLWPLFIEVPQLLTVLHWDTLSCNLMPHQ